MATPPCLPPRGPGLAGEAATLVWGMRPAVQAAAVCASQWVSWIMMTASLLTASSMTLLLARACGALPLASHLAFHEMTSAGSPRP
eukprot:9873272-Lingulodinium_polyedra.AAC.1